LISVDTGEMYPMPRPMPPQHAVAEVDQPQLLVPMPERADEEAGGPEAGGDEHGLAGSVGLDPGAADCGGEPSITIAMLKMTPMAVWLAAKCAMSEFL
jgi:hypothetical protein